MIKLTDLLKQNLLEELSPEDYKIQDPKIWDQLEKALPALEKAAKDKNVDLDLLIKAFVNVKNGTVANPTLNEVDFKKVFTPLVISALLSLPTSALNKDDRGKIEKAQQKSSTTATVKQDISVNPNFWVSDTNDIKKVQNLFKLYRYYTLNQWMNNKAMIMADEFGEKYYSELSDQERNTIKKAYMAKVPLTREDGFNGRYTSTFVFPPAFLKDLNTGKIENLGQEGNTALQAVRQDKLSSQEIQDWNSFVSWMKANDYSGSDKMNNSKYSNSVLKLYKGGDSSSNLAKM